VYFFQVLRHESDAHQCLRFPVSVGPMSNTQWYSLWQMENIIMREFTQLASGVLQYCDDIYIIYETATTTTAIKLILIRD